MHFTSNSNRSNDSKKLPPPPPPPAAAPQHQASVSSPSSNTTQQQHSSDGHGFPTDSASPPPGFWSPGPTPSAMYPACYYYNSHHENYYSSTSIPSMNSFSSPPYGYTYVPGYGYSNPPNISNPTSYSSGYVEYWNKYWNGSNVVADSNVVMSSNDTKQLYGYQPNSNVTVDYSNVVKSNLSAASKPNYTYVNPRLYQSNPSTDSNSKSNDSKPAYIYVHPRHKPNVSVDSTNSSNLSNSSNYSNVSTEKSDTSSNTNSMDSTPNYSYGYPLTHQHSNLYYPTNSNSPYYYYYPSYYYPSSYLNCSYSNQSMGDSNPSSFNSSLDNSNFFTQVLNSNKPWRSNLLSSNSAAIFPEQLEKHREELTEFEFRCVDLLNSIISFHKAMQKQDSNSCGDLLLKVCQDRLMEFSEAYWKFEDDYQQIMDRYESDIGALMLETGNLEQVLEDVAQRDSKYTRMMNHLKWELKSTQDLVRQFEKVRISPKIFESNPEENSNLSMFEHVQHALKQLEISDGTEKQFEFENGKNDAFELNLNSNAKNSQNDDFVSHWNVENHDFVFHSNVKNIFKNNNSLNAKSYDSIFDSNLKTNSKGFRFDAHFDSKVDEIEDLDEFDSSAIDSILNNVESVLREPGDSVFESNVKSLNAMMEKSELDSKVKNFEETLLGDLVFYSKAEKGLKDGDSNGQQFDPNVKVGFFDDCYSEYKFNMSNTNKRKFESNEDCSELSVEFESNSFNDSTDLKFEGIQKQVEALITRLDESTNPNADESGSNVVTTTSTTPMYSMEHSNVPVDIEPLVTIDSVDPEAQDESID